MVFRTGWWELAFVGVWWSWVKLHNDEQTVLHTHHTLLRHQPSKGRGNSRYGERLHVHTQLQYVQMRQCTVQRNTTERSRNHCCREKKKNNITHSECVSVSWVIQHALRTRHIILYPETCLAATIFCHITSWTARFSEIKLVNTKCVFRFPLQLLSETFIILRRNQRNHKRTRLHVRRLLFSPDFNLYPANVENIVSF